MKKGKSDDEIEKNNLQLGFWLSVAEPDKKLWGGRNQNKLKYINHII
jgi:hypothetical protein